MVSRGIEDFVEHFDKERQGWRIIPEVAEKSPRAPWWYQAERKDRFEEFSLNPTAEILGYLYDCRQQVPSETIALASNRVLSELSTLDKIEMHELLCCLRLLQSASLPQDVGEQVRTRLLELIDSTVACNPDDWKGYSLRPLQVADTPDSPFMAGLEDAVAANLDHEISSQNTDGSWTPTWSWDDTFPEEWTKAKIEWSGVITIEKLLTLKRFERIEEIA